jgi:hypothetical protein
MIVFWRAKIIFSLDQVWFSKVGSNDGGISELSLHLQIKISVPQVKTQSKEPPK